MGDAGLESAPDSREEPRTHLENGMASSEPLSTPDSKSMISPSRSTGGVTGFALNRALGMLIYVLCVDCGFAGDRTISRKGTEMDLKRR